MIDIRRLFAIAVLTACSQQVGPVTSPATLKSPAPVPDPPSEESAPPVAEPVAPDREPEPKPAWYVAHERGRAFIYRWAQAQRDLDLAAYLAHYAPNADLAGHRRTFAGSPITTIGVPAMSSGGADDTTVIATLPRRTWRGDFSDHSRVSLVIDTVGTPRITSERTDWSRPGWDDAEVPIFDGSKMTSPISVRVRSAGRDTDCVTRAAVVELTDATGATATIPIRSDADIKTATHAVAFHGKQYAWTDACTGIRIERSIFKHFDDLVLREEWADDASGAGKYLHKVAILPLYAAVRMQ